MSHQPSICISAVTVSSTETEKTEHPNYSEVHVGSQQHKLTRRSNGSLHRQFANPIELTSACQVTLHAKSRWTGRRKTLKVDTQDLFASTGEDTMQVTQGKVRVAFHREVESNDGTLSPTTRSILQKCPRFRILVIGKTGVGKSSLISETFGIDEANASSITRGKATIDDELISPNNEHFVLHDSLGFEPGDNVNYDIVKDFIRRRQNLPLKDQLHAIWFCIATPRAGGRLLEAAAEEFFKTKHNTLGSVPIVVVFTKLDQIVDHKTIELAKDNPGRPEKDIEKLARSEAESAVQSFCATIAGFSGESEIPYKAVSTKMAYKDTLSSLIEQTYHLVGADDIADALVKSVVTAMAQRIDPILNIQESINIGRQRYWKALRSSPNFTGHSVQDCLSVIHTDIITVWNFHDPGCHLTDDKFKVLVIDLVDKMPTRAISNRLVALSGTSLVAAVSGLIGAISNPAAPIVLPILATLAIAVWAYDVYQNARIVQQRFIAYIVDLTHIMETLFILTGGDHRRLTRRAIKLAYKTYIGSDVMAQAHKCILGYRDLDGRDAALEMIEKLIWPELSGGSYMREYYDEVNELSLGKLALDKEEEW